MVVSGADRGGRTSALHRVVRFKLRRVRPPDVVEVLGVEAFQVLKVPLVEIPVPYAVRVRADSKEPCAELMLRFFIG